MEKVAQKTAESPAPIGIAAIMAKRAEYAAAMRRNEQDVKRGRPGAQESADRCYHMVMAWDYALGILRAETPDERDAAMEAARLLREAVAAEKPNPDSRARPLDCIRAGIDARDAQIVAWCKQEMGIAKSEAQDIASTRDGEGARQSIERAEGRASAFLEVAILLRGSP